jgi:curved DNA-binding protein CbpA
MVLPLANYYQILDVDLTATEAEIKRSYRRLAKKFHPDLHPDRREWAQGEFLTVSEAYRVLGDPQKRAAYDTRYRRLFRTEDRKRPPGWPWQDAVQKAARSVLNELLQQHGAVAIRLYEGLKSRSGLADPLARLETRDYLDCKFLLGEAYESAGDPNTALDLFEEVYEEEREEPRLRCYFEAVLDRLRQAYGDQLSAAQDPQTAQRFYEKALAMETTNGNRANVHKRMAEVLLGMGDLQTARKCLRKAFQANPNLKGVQKMTRKLGLKPGDN